MRSLKGKTIKGVVWGSINNFANQGIQFLVGVILARLISPEEFGLIGMLTVFISVSDSFINSGLGSALVRKKNCTNKDYSTVFYFNLLVGVSLYLVLFFSSESIANFFSQPQLEKLTKALGLILIINAVTIIQNTITTKRVDFKLYAKISVIAGVTSGIVAIIMAYNGFGVWSLVVRTLLFASLHSLFLWFWNTWRPSLVFSKTSFKELFGFGVNILGSSLVGKIGQNINTLVIGKYFSAADLGFYSRAEGFKNIPSQNINTIISKVSYPILSQIQDEPKRLKEAYKKILTIVTFFSFTVMAGLAAVAEPFILMLIGDKWRPSIVFLQMLCVPGMLYPLQALNLNILNVKGKSDWHFKLTVIKTLFRIPFLIIGVILGINYLLGGMIILAFIEYYLNSFYSGKLIEFSLKEQLIDIMPIAILSISMFLFVFLLGKFLSTAYVVIDFVILSSVGFVFVVIISEIFRLKSYLIVKGLLVEQYNNLRNF